MKWAIYFLALIRHCDNETSDEICTRLEFAPRYKAIFCRRRFEADRCLLGLEHNHLVTNSELYKRLSGFRTELILYMMAATKKETVKRSISHFFTRLRYIDSSITGKDLKKMGLPPGPIYREILQAVLDAKLNGQLKTRRDEMAFINNYVS